MTTYQRILHIAGPYKKFLYGGIFFNLLYSLLNIVSVGAMLPLFKVIFSEKRMAPGQNPTWDGQAKHLSAYLQQKVDYVMNSNIQEHGDVKVLVFVCLLVAAMFLIRNLFRYIGAICMVQYRVGISLDMRSNMYQKFLALPVSFFTEQRKGDMMSRISNDIGGVEGNIMGVLSDMINAPIYIIVSLVSLFTLDYQLTLFSLLVFPVMGFIISWTGKKLKKQATFAQAELGNMFSIIEETLKSNKIIKIFNAEKILANNFKKSTNLFRFHALNMSKRRELASPISEFLGTITLLLITFFAGKQILENHASPASFLVFLGLFYQILDPAKKITNAISSFQAGMPALKRVVEVLDYDLQVHEVENPQDITSFNQGIEFKNITFAYNEDKTILENFSLSIPKGKSVALVGQSGSGKTTIANLITRFYDVNEGQMLVDGQDVKTLNLKQYRGLIGLVTQESVLFNDSIASNIGIGKDICTLEEIEEAAKIANAHEFIAQLPEGYNSMIGDDGGKLSGGQKQRIAIARAVLKNPPIMILDEATSALDSESERLVQDALDNMMKNRTSIIIAHRLSTIQKADVIVVMEKGKILEQGSHTELYAQGGHYKRLVDLQQFS
jgi:ATP-binding cassette, subfamily B, bacterial MsbA